MSRANLHDSGALDLFPEWREPVTSRRVFRAVAGSLLLHALFLALLLILPESVPRNTLPVTADFRKTAIPLVAPKILEVTQKDPNKGKITPQLDVRSALPAPPRARAFVPPASAGIIAPPAPAIPSPPQIQAAVPAPSVSGGMPALPQLPEKPKIVLEDISPPAGPATLPENPSIKAPSTALDQIARAAVQPGKGGLVISPDGASEATALRQMQLLSDPQGVDFKPYLLQVLARVRRNWMAIVPDSARMGRRGLVLIQFSIDRGGGVPKLVIASTSGITAFDRAAVAGISASNPFPPLPAAYQGDQIRLQMAFSYNLPPAAKP